MPPARRLRQSPSACSVPSWCGAMARRFRWADPRSARCSPTCWPGPTGWCRSAHWSSRCGGMIRRRAPSGRCRRTWLGSGGPSSRIARPVPGAHCWSGQGRAIGFGSSHAGRRAAVRGALAHVVRSSSPTAIGLHRRCCGTRSGCGRATRWASSSTSRRARPRPAAWTRCASCAIEDRVDADLAAGAASELVAELESLVAHHEFRERLWAQLMLALYRSGRQRDALAAYRRARTVLVEQLGIEPGRELRALEAAILDQDRPRSAAAAGTRRSGCLRAAGVGRTGVRRARRRAGVAAHGLARRRRRARRVRVGARAGGHRQDPPGRRAGPRGAALRGRRAVRPLRRRRFRHPGACSSRRSRRRSLRTTSMRTPWPSWAGR